MTDRVVDRAEACRRIRDGLREKTGRAWSVTGGRGTAWGWLRISAPPRRRTNDWEGGPPTEDGGGRYYLTAEDAEDLAEALGLDRPVHPQGISVPPDAWARYVALAEDAAT